MQEIIKFLVIYSDLFITFMTFVNLVVIIANYVANSHSAKATQGQLDELKRQHEEEHRRLYHMSSYMNVKEIPIGTDYVLLIMGNESPLMFGYNWTKILLTALWTWTLRSVYESWMGKSFH